MVQDESWYLESIPKQWELHPYIDHVHISYMQWTFECDMTIDIQRHKKEWELRGKPPPDIQWRIIGGRTVKPPVRWTAAMVNNIKPKYVHSLSHYLQSIDGLQIPGARSPSPYVNSRSVLFCLRLILLLSLLLNSIMNNKYTNISDRCNYICSCLLEVNKYWHSYSGVCLLIRTVTVKYSARCLSILFSCMYQLLLPVTSYVLRQTFLEPKLHPTRSRVLVTSLHL